MDQLYDYPADHQSLFIHWYVWAYYTSVFIGQAGWTFLGNSNDHYSFFIAMAFLAFASLGGLILPSIVLLVAQCKTRWFLTDSARRNPYKLVLRVSKFACQHKTPIRRSAFTYCEDNIPSGLDLGKHKYGGPFTTEQVEDVKAFYGILKILLILGITFFLDIAVDPILMKYADHLSTYNTDGGDYTATDIIQIIILQDGLLSPLLVMLSMPIYICFLRPFTKMYNIRMLKRIGFGIVIMLISVTCTFIMDIVAHKTHKNTLSCMFDTPSYDIDVPTNVHLLPLLLQRSLLALSNMVIYTALYEFICAQSPQSLKGLLIGLSFAIRGLFELLAAVATVPFIFVKSSTFSCGMGYFLMNISVGVVGLLLYVYVAKKYQLRQRDEPCHVRRYVEEYYSKTQREQHYDYD